MRQLISQSMPGRNGLLELTGKDYRYLRRVLRVKAGDMIDVMTAGDIVETGIAAGTFDFLATADPWSVEGWFVVDSIGREQRLWMSALWASQ